jgi:hypothetical protein
MNQINYDSMSTVELKEYFLKHRGDRSAFQVYLARINERPLRIIASPEDPDFDEQVRDAIRQKLEAGRRNKAQQSDRFSYERLRQRI